MGIEPMLTAELQPGGPAPKQLPQEHFGQGHFAAKPAGFVDLRTLERLAPPSTMLRMVPLPVPGRILRQRRVQPSFPSAAIRNRVSSSRSSLV
jgi:hypothetical protein